MFGPGDLEKFLFDLSLARLTSLEGTVLFFPSLAVGFLESPRVLAAAVPSLLAAVCGLLTLPAVLLVVGF